MFARLALGNIRRTLRDYAVYAVTLVLGVAVFYAFNTIVVQADFLQYDTRETIKSLRYILADITVALAIVMGFLMIYANNFMMRRRTKELGLYQVLGMHVGQVNAILALETLIVALISLVIGIALGALLSQLMLFATASLFKTKITRFHFFFSLEALGLTVACFALMFLVMMVFNTHSLRRVRLVELMESGRHSEGGPSRSLPVSLALFAGGIALIVFAYLRLINQGIPGFSENPDTNMLDFTITTIIVTAGTIMFFFGLSGTLAGFLSRTRGYWRDLHLFTIRQIASRVNTTSASMALIAMILFLAITAVTTGMLIIRVVNAQMEASIPFDASVISMNPDATGSDPVDLAAAMRKAGLEPSKIGDCFQVNTREISNDPGNESTSYADQFTINSIAKRSGQEVPASLEDKADAESVLLVSQSDFNGNRKLLGLDPIRLSDNQYLALSTDSQAASRLINKALAKDLTFTIMGTTLSPAQTATVGDRSATLMNEGTSNDVFTLVVPDKVADQCTPFISALNFEYKNGTTKQSDAALAGRIESRLESELEGSVLIYTASSIMANSTTTTGLITYLAIYIGLVLVVACAAILAIQQLSAASDAKDNYRVLGELGCPEQLVWRSLRTQTVFAFVFPLAVGIAHACCALTVIRKPLEAFGYYNLAASSRVTLAIFILVYGAYLLLTYRTAHGIVLNGLRSGRKAL